MATGLSRTVRVVGWTLRVFAALLVIAIPAAGVWVGSSLAAYLNGPVWLVCLAGLLLFPGLPTAWAWHARRKRGSAPGALTFWDQVVVRTFAINAVFLGGLLWASPQTVFTAVSSRGDWMLESFEGASADAAREWIHNAADGFDWLYDAENAYEDLVDADATEAPAIPQSDDDDPWRAPFEVEPEPESEPKPEPESELRPEPRAPGQWPQPTELHPAVVSMPAAAKQNVTGVGRWIAQHESNPFDRVKAIHDFVADHVAYDAPALAQGRYPPQDADTVLRTGVGVCAGYANLLKAIADVTGDEVSIVTGDSRGAGGDIAGGGHAWNAAKIDDRWYLIDSTWDAGFVNGQEFTKEYSTGYLFVPPAIMGISHFPSEAGWQLRSEPLGRGEFVRQPMMRPEFFAAGLTLESPTRSQVSVDDRVEIVLRNPKGLFVLASYTRQDGTRGARCTVNNGREATISCEFDGEGTYQVTLFAAPKRVGSYPMVGRIQVNASG